MGEIQISGRGIVQKTLGLIGCGNIGSLVANRAQGLQMRVIAYDPFLSEEKAQQLGVEKVELAELLTRSDAISLHVPMNDATRNILSREALQKTKEGVILVNAARGGLVDEQALADLLNSGHIGAAAFDVYAEEPATNNILFAAKNATCTPHLGASTLEAQDNVAFQVADQIADFLLDGAITNAVNTASVTAEEAPRLAPYLALTDKLGSLAGQVMGSGLEKVEICYEGEISGLNTKPLSASLLSALLKPILTSVNPISAPQLAKSRGIYVAQRHSSDSEVFENLVRVLVTTENGTKSYAATMFGGEPRIVEMLDVGLEAAFSPAMLFLINKDRPGVIGQLGQTLGAAGLNIATFHLGREKEGDTAVCLIALDLPIDMQQLEVVRALDHVERAEALQFG